ncbi:MAG: VWA domain-containing protein [Bacteroidota bacterium]
MAAFQKLEEEFNRFIEFGTLLDRTTRKYLVHYLAHKLQLDWVQPPELADQYYQYFCTALDDLLGDEELQLLCKNRPILSQQLAVDTLKWIRKTHRQVEARNPFYEEQKRLQAVSIMPLTRFEGKWYIYTDYLKHQYRKEEFDVGFYEDKFKALNKQKDPKNEKGNVQAAWERIIKDYLSQWDALLQAKLLAYQLRKLTEEKENFQELLEAKLQEYKKLNSLISPFTNYLGSYWDLSRSLWQDVSFDVLQRYHDLLQDEESIRKLAELLGNMREAEIITEEETFEKKIVRQEWIVDSMQKAEIVGVHESDDLNALTSGEVGLLADEATESVFLKKYADKGLLTFKFEDKQVVKSEHHFTEKNIRVRKKEKGPFIVCVDTSDSMSGMAEHIAKVLCFAIIKIAVQQHRQAYLINFSTGIQCIDLLQIGNSLDEIAAFLQMSFHGGTDITLAFYEVFRQLDTDQYEDADVLIISDFIMYKLDEDLLNRVQYHQQNRNTQFYSLILSENPNAEVVNHFDATWLYDPEKKGVIEELNRKIRVQAERP